MTDEQEVTNAYDDPGFDRLIAQSSLGSRVSAAQVDKVCQRMAEQDQTQPRDSGATDD